MQSYRARDNALVTERRGRFLRDVVKEPFGLPGVSPFGAKARLTFDPPQLREKRAVRLACTLAVYRRPHDPIIAVAADRRGAELVYEETTDGIRRIRADTGMEMELHDVRSIGASVIARADPRDET